MQKKPVRALLLIFVALVLVVCAFGGGFVAGNYAPVLKPAASTALPVT